MPTENYDRLSANKKDTQVNIKSYLENQQDVDLDQRKQNLQASFDNPQLSPYLILQLEELRDLELGISWTPFGPKDDGSYDLIRDCRQQDTVGRDTEKAKKISYVIQSTNLLLGAKKVLELEGKNTDEINELLQEQISKLNSTDKIDIKKFNTKVVSLLKNQGISEAKAKLTTAKDFVSMDNRQFHISTLTKQKDSQGEDKTVVESDMMLLGLTDTQRAEYNKIKDWQQGQNLNIDWFDQLSDFDKQLVQGYAAKIAQGNVMLPTQTREQLAGLRNAYEKSVFVCNMDGSGMEQVLEVLHTGTPSFHGKGDKVKQTAPNLAQLDSFIPGGVKITDNALNSPNLADGIPNFLNKIDREAPDLIMKAQKQLGSGTCAITPFNGMRRSASNDNHGFDINLLKLGTTLENQQGLENIANYLINGTNKDQALDQLGGLNDNPDLQNALKNAMKAKDMIINPHSMFEVENQNLDLVTAMTLVDFACNNENGTIKKIFPEVNIGKVNIHCASGKDRTGLSVTDATNKAVSEKLGLSEEQSRENLKTQIKGGHTQELASLNGGTPGCHGVKSDSKTALSKTNPLGSLIEETASFNKIKTKKTTGDKVKNFFKKASIAVAAIITLPLIIAAATIATVGYAVHFGIKNMSKYSPNQDDLDKMKSASVSTKEPLTKSSDKSLSQNQNQSLGPHTNKILEERSTFSSLDKGIGG